jgi:excisionase family DNA binding protein
MSTYTTVRQGENSYATVLAPKREVAMTLLTSARSRLITTSEAAQLLNVSRRTVTNWIKEDLIPYVQLPGGDYRIPLDALLRSLSGTYDLAAELRGLEDVAVESSASEEEVVEALIGESGDH